LPTAQQTGRSANLRQDHHSEGLSLSLAQALNACGINSKSQFADLEGLGDHLAWLFENKWLAAAGRADPEDDGGEER